MSILKRNRNQTIMKTDPAERGEYYDEKGKETSSTFNNVRSSKFSNSMFGSQEGSLVKGGTNTVLNALAAYLRYLEGTARDDWQEYVVGLLLYILSIILVKIGTYHSLALGLHRLL